MSFGSLPFGPEGRFWVQADGIIRLNLMDREAAELRESSRSLAVIFRGRNTGRS